MTQSRSGPPARFIPSVLLILLLLGGPVFARPPRLPLLLSLRRRSIPLPCT
jgi:hypothetical protein